MMFSQVEVQCCKCGVVFGIEAAFYKILVRDKTSFYCTNGHGQSYTESEADKLRRERDRLQQQLAHKDDTIAQQRNEIIARKGQITKLQKRAKAGTCPCCQRTFSNMTRHMKTQHPEFDPGNVGNVVDITAAKKKA